MSRSSHDLPPPELAWIRKTGVDQRREVEIELFTTDDLPDDHRRLRWRLLARLV